jgi:hypothetical protein
MRQETHAQVDAHPSTWGLKSWVDSGNFTVRGRKNVDSEKKFIKT